MIYHELFGQHLRLGNFAFKIAWSVRMKHIHNLDTVYPDYYLWKYLETSPLISNKTQGEILRPINWEWSLQEQVLLEQNVLSREHSIVALNYFLQSQNWFDSSKKQVKEFFTFKEEYVDQVKQKYSYIFDKERPIAIGLRLGDFIGHGDFYQIPYNWYTKTLEENFPYWKERPVVVFSDDIDKAKTIFAEYPFYYPDPNNTHTHSENFKHYHSEKAAEQFVLGTLIDDWIIGNSTFSWWQAWLGNYNSVEGQVFHSGKLFSPTGNMKHIDITHYYPLKWNLIE